jgi:hypothetical protein
VEHVSVADLTYALCRVVACGNSCLQDSGADEEIVADLNGEKQAGASTTDDARKQYAAPATALRLLLSTTFFKTKLSK